MLRMLFFFMGVPLMIMSFFETIDVMPYASDYTVMVDGKQIELTIDQKADLREKVESLFGNCHTMPAFGVVTPKIYEEQTKDGIYVSIKFDQTFCVNELPFDELVFNVNKDFMGFNLIRGNKGVYQGRCIYMSVVDGNMDDLYNFITGISGKPEIETQPSQEENVQEEKVQTENETEKIS